jgi:hypothetical protein
MTLYVRQRFQNFYLCDPTVSNGMCNAVHYEVGPLTTVCAPVLIIEAVDAITTLSRICGSWL